MSLFFRIISCFPSILGKGNQWALKIVFKSFQIAKRIGIWAEGGLEEGMDTALYPRTLPYASLLFLCYIRHDMGI